MRLFKISILAVAFLVLSGGSCKQSDQSAVQEGQVAGFAVQDSVAENIAALNKILYDVGEKQNGEGVAPALEALKKAAETDPVAKIYWALARPLVELDGIVWRVGDIARESDPFYAGVSSLIRGINYRSYVFGDHIYQLLVYLTRPQAKAEDGRFQSLRQIQLWALAKLKPALLESIKMLQDVEPKNVSFLVDMKLFAGIKNRGQEMNFISEKNEYETFVPYYVSYLISQFQRGVATIDVLCAYQMNELPYFINELVHTSIKKGMRKVTTLLREQFFGRDHNDEESKLRLMNPVDFAQVLRSASYRNMFVIQDFKDTYQEKAVNITGAALMEDARSQLVDSLDAELKSLEAYVTHGRELDGMGEGKYDRAQKFIWNPLEVLLKADDIRKALQDRRDLLNGKGEHLSIVTGKNFKINAKAFFAGHRDLKVFFPNKFDEESNRSDYENVTLGARTEPVLLYRKGNPLSWPEPTFGGVFPDLRGASGDAVKARLREVALDFSTSIFGVFLPAPNVFASW